MIPMTDLKARISEIIRRYPAFAFVNPVGLIDELTEAIISPSAEAEAEEAHMRGLLLAQVDLIADALLAGATLPHRELHKLAVLRGAHQTASESLDRAIGGRPPTARADALMEAEGMCRVIGNGKWGPLTADGKRYKDGREVAGDLADAIAALNTTTG